MNLRYADLYGADLIGAKGLPEAPVVEDLDKKMLEVVSAKGALDMRTWHTCQTTHCRAGWAVTLAGKAGKELEDRLSTPVAAMLIYKASTGRDTCPDFYCSDKKALSDIKKCAEGK